MTEGPLPRFWARLLAWCLIGMVCFGAAYWCLSPDTPTVASAARKAFGLAVLAFGTAYLTYYIRAYAKGNW